MVRTQLGCSWSVPAPTTSVLTGRFDRRIGGVDLPAARWAAPRYRAGRGSPPFDILVHLDERLGERFRLLTGGPRTAQARQRTLRATIDWSFELLSAAEQEVLGRLSVFVGGFELEAAEAVCSTDTLADTELAGVVGSLVNKNLVVAERSSACFATHYWRACANTETSDCWPPAGS